MLALGGIANSAAVGPSGQITRERLVEAGVAVVRREGARPLPDVQPVEVAKCAGVPKGALYQYWESFDDY